MGVTWRGTPWITAAGYRRGRVKDYPYPRKSGQVYEHVAVVELAEGRRLEPWEHVHHLDGDKLRNCRENLEIREASDHTSYHARRQRRHPTGKYAPPPPDGADEPVPF